MVHGDVAGEAAVAGLARSSRRLSGGSGWSAADGARAAGRSRLGRRHGASLPWLLGAVSWNGAPGKSCLRRCSLLGPGSGGDAGRVLPASGESGHCGAARLVIAWAGPCRAVGRCRWGGRRRFRSACIRSRSEAVPPARWRIGGVEGSLGGSNVRMVVDEARRRRAHLWCRCRSTLACCGRRAAPARPCTSPVRTELCSRAMPGSPPS